MSPNGSVKSGARIEHAVSRGRSASRRPDTPGMTSFSWGFLNASVVLAVVPTVALAAFVWHFVVEGLLEGGVEN